MFQLLNAVGQVRRAVTVMPDISNLHINNGKQPFLLANSFPCTIKCFIFNISAVDFFKVFYKLLYMLNLFFKTRRKTFYENHWTWCIHINILNIGQVWNMLGTALLLRLLVVQLFMIVVSFQQCYLIFDSKLFH